MNLTEEQLKQIFQQQTARSTARQVDCLTEDQFARAASGAMDQQERSAVARHLIACSDCVEEYRIVRSLKSWANEADQALGATLPVESREEALPVRMRNTSVAIPSFGNRLRAVFPLRVAVAVAAMLFLVLFAGVFLVWNRQEHNRELAGLNQQLADRDRALNSVQESLSEKQRRLDELETSARGQTEKPNQHQAVETGTPSDSRAGDNTERLKEEIATLRQSARDLAQPQLEVPIIDLDPSPVRGGSSGPTTAINVPPTAKSFTVILNFSGESFPAHEVEILDGPGRTVWRGQVRGKGGSRSINLTLSRSLFANGNYLIKLYGLKDGSRERVAEYPLQVRYQ